MPLKIPSADRQIIGIFLLFCDQINDHKLRRIEQPYRNCMAAQPSADNHLFLILFIITAVIFREQPIGRGNHPADTRNPYNSAVNMSGKRQICAPAGIGVKKTGLWASNT